jgi:transcription termination factor Rho
MDAAVATEAVLQQIMRTKTNLEFLETLNGNM